MSSKYSVYSKNIFQSYRHKFVYINAYSDLPEINDISTRDFSEIYFITNGESIIQIEDDTLHLKKDDLLIINENVLHGSIIKNTPNFECYVCGIDGLHFHHEEGVMSDRNEMLYHLSNHAKDRDSLLICLENLMNEYKHKSVMCENMIDSILEIFLINLIRISDNKLTLLSAKKVNKECLYIKQYIDNNYHENITLESLTALIDLNKYYLVHSFKKYLGISPINYLIEKRLEASRKLLENTDEPISKIAQLVGFSSQSYFSQYFKKSMHMSPKDYRNNHR